MDTQTKIVHSDSKDESASQPVQLLVEQGKDDILIRKLVDQRTEKKSSDDKSFEVNTFVNSFDLPMKGAKVGKIPNPIYNQPAQEVVTREIDNLNDGFNKSSFTGTWKHLAITVFCGTPGKIHMRPKQMIFFASFNNNIFYILTTIANR